MQEYGFELVLAAHLEREREDIISRQLGTAVYGRRIMDLVCIEPGPEFERRVEITPETIPTRAIESNIGPGRFQFWRKGFEGKPEHARSIVEQAIDCGFFEQERRKGRTYIRQTTRYPDWFGRVVGIENKPDLGRPGELETQLLTDVTLGLLDEIILATESYVTRAHKNRIPNAVGIWRFDPETSERTVIREPTQLPATSAGIDILERTSTRTEIRVVTAAEKERTRQRVAERAYGKGWRTYDLPGCTEITPASSVLPADQQDARLPYCAWHGRIVHPTKTCSPDCPGYCAGDPPTIDYERVRESRTGWDGTPDGHQRTQSGLDQFLD